MDRSEGDVNLSDLRTAWQQKNIDEKTRAILDEDAKVFLHQSLSTPCLNVITKCEGIYIYDNQGQRIIDCHGNSVHQVCLNFIVNALAIELGSCHGL